MAKKRRKKAQCPNCGWKIEGAGNYCSNCGQENHDLNVSFKHLFLDVIENTFHFDTKLFNSVRAIVTSPGKITSDFNKGIRASYVSPARLYVFVAAIYFIVFSFNLSHSSLPVISLNKAPTKDIKETGIDLQFDKARVHLNYDELLVASESSIAQMDSLLKSKNIPVTWLNRIIVEKMASFSVNPQGNKHFFDKTLKNLSVAMFFLMPLFALLLLLMFSRKQFLYFHHIIFALHYHSVLFTILLLSELSVLLFSFSFIKTAWVAVFVYLFVALHNVYGNSWFKTFMKFLGVIVLYLILTAIGIVASAVVSFLLS